LGKEYNLLSFFIPVLAHFSHSLIQFPAFFLFSLSYCRYKNDPEILAMTNLIAAYQRNEILEFEKILKVFLLSLA